MLCWDVKMVYSIDLNISCGELNIQMIACGCDLYILCKLIARTLMLVKIDCIVIFVKFNYDLQLDGTAEAPI